MFKLICVMDVFNFELIINEVFILFFKKLNFIFKNSVGNEIVMG